MPYVVIEDFKAGLDTRKLAAASPTGSLQKLSNGHITRGGEIEKRKAWVAKYVLPAGRTFGFTGAVGALYTFGSDAAPAIPAGVNYQQLVHPTGSAMVGVTAAGFFDGKLFVAATYANGDSLCFYDGVRVTDWDAGSNAVMAGRAATAIMTTQSKVYATFGSVLGFSAVSAPTAWQSGSGYGFINMANNAAGSEALTALGQYQNYMAVFSRRATQIWYMDPDPLQDTKRQVISNVGTMAAKSVVAYGDADTFFLSDTGVRSLRARDASNQANVNDVGTAIDGELTDYMGTLTPTVLAGAAAVVTPIDGRYILALGAKAYVFSYFPTGRISAWSTYDLGFSVSDFVVSNNQTWARSGDTLYLYGDDDGQTYDDCAVEVELPYIDGRSVATFKEFTGLDLVCEGEWRVYINTDPQRPDAESLVAIVNGTTLAGLDIATVGSSPIVKLRLESARTGPAKLSKVIIHYKPTKADG